MWNFQSPLSVVSVPYTVNGSYTPLVGDYTGDGVDDIHWYAPGPAGDPLWEFDPGGSFTTVVRNVNGAYRPVVASIGKDDTDDTIWYGPTSPDSVWDWTQGTTEHTTKTVSVRTSAYEPFEFDYFGDGPRSEDVYWYIPGGGIDPVWDYFYGTVSRGLDDLATPYDDLNDAAVAGDFFADGRDDVMFPTGGTGFVLYDSSYSRDFIYDASAGDGVAPTSVRKAPR
jgi:hypothetical protein